MGFGERIRQRARVGTPARLRLARLIYDRCGLQQCAKHRRRRVHRPHQQGNSGTRSLNTEDELGLRFVVARACMNSQMLMCPFSPILRAVVDYWTWSFDQVCSAADDDPCPTDDPDSATTVILETCIRNVDVGFPRVLRTNTQFPS